MKSELIKCRTCNKYHHESVIVETLKPVMNYYTGKYRIVSYYDRCTFCDDAIKEKLLYKEESYYE